MREYPNRFFFNSMLDAHTKNMCIGISCNKKSREVITPRVAEEIIYQAASFTSGQLGILIADEIMKFNEMALDASPKKSYKIAMGFGDYFFNLFNEVLQQFDIAIRDRISIFRWADMTTDQYKFEIENVRRIYETNDVIKAAVDKAALQLLQWRCPDITPNQKRMAAMLEYIFWEIPSVGGWKKMELNHITYDGLIYPAINPRGMRIIAGIVAEFDKILHDPQRTLWVIHLTEEGSLVDNLETSAQQAGLLANFGVLKRSESKEMHPDEMTEKNILRI